MELALMENRNGLIFVALATRVLDHAERMSALHPIEPRTIRLGRLYGAAQFW
jgi:hypothetical protein